MTSPSLLGTELTVWTIRLSLFCLVWSLFEAINSHSFLRPRRARYIWFVGAILSAVHAAAAMGFYHAWNHENALVDTTEKTKQVVGISIGFGLYFNYLFVVTWLSDAIWWVLFPENYSHRKKWIHALVIGYLLFIATNGAIVFESGPVRWIGIVALVSLVAFWFRSLGKVSANTGRS